MVNWIVEPWQYEFFQRAFLASLMAGFLCAIVGVYVVLRRMSLIGHALTHSAFPGIVLAYIFKWNLLWGAMASLLTAGGIAISSEKRNVQEDSAIGIVIYAMFAIGNLVMSAAKSYRDMLAMLFGNVLGVSVSDLWMLGKTVVTVLALVCFYRKEMALFCFDPVYARSIGISINFLRGLILFLLALTVVVGIQAVGALWTSTLLVTPAPAARTSAALKFSGSQ